MQKRVMNKSGVSAVVATVLIIMITVAAVGIIWAAIIPMIRDNLGGSVQCNDADITIGTSQGYTCYDSSQKIVAVQVVKGANEINVSELKFSVSSSGSSVSYNIESGVDKGSSKVFYLDVFSLTSINQVGVIPVLKSGKALKECTSVVLNNVPSCSLGEILESYEILSIGGGALKKNGDSCSIGSECRSRFCVLDMDFQNPTCSSGNSGSLCWGASDCKSGRCLGNVCSDGSAGSRCDEANLCLAGFNCINNLCSDGGLGSTCALSTDCKSTFCSSLGLCTDGSVHSPCSDNFQCASGFCGFYNEAYLTPNQCSECGPNLGCAAGFVCLQYECADGSARDPCISDSDCDSPLRCVIGPEGQNWCGAP